ncbi:tyrosine-type recombinase/integrase [Hymenobacter lutimineralis]|uniref:Tyrosine recombinase XerC n=1 Tax=Hymenobacter lutimineralis TaxID=2606448 RepID=A0A5D6VEX4_9BACT|nr:MULTISPECIES: tyrosine-type recombinase/integrase [Hymenobacter]QIX61162.1 tyrosine-type recombinase/integrase [Hymenobacter sp. BT18]TYZ13379.1 tyrosine-type recombinase/integrase [Hymenobacter lutimineralis]
MELFFSYLRSERRYSPHTLLSYQTDLRQFGEYLAATYELGEPAQADHTLIRSWIVELMQQNLDPRTVNRKIACLRSYYKFLLRTGIIAKNPMLRITAPKMAKKLPDFVPEDSLNGLLNSFEFPETFEGTRDQLVLELLYGTGIRLSELIGIRHDDLSLPGRTVRVTGKGNKQRIVPLNPSLVLVLERYIAQKQREFPAVGNAAGALLVTNKQEPLYEKFVYRTVKHYLSQITTAASQQHPHVLRHSFATHLLSKGADLNAIKELLGHANLAATQVYTHLSIDKLKAVFEKAHPKA